MSDATGALAAYQNFQSQQNQGTGDPTATTDPNVTNQNQGQSTIGYDPTFDEGAETTYDETVSYGDDDPMMPPGGAGGGYVASTNNGLGILAPYHQRLIDGLYAGGRIHYQ